MLLCTQPFLSAENAAALKSKIGTAQALQKIAVQQQAPTLSEEQKQAIAQKIASGEHRKKDPSKGGTQSVIGWEKIDGDGDIAKNRYKFAKETLEKNQFFVELMQDFANPDDPESDNFGAGKAGKYAKINLIFELMTADEMEKFTGKEQNNEPAGMVLTEILSNGKWLEVPRYFQGERKDIKNMDKDIRVRVLLNNEKPAPDPQGSGSQYAKPILILTHEVVLHARHAAERVYIFKNDPKATIASLKNAIMDATNEFRLPGDIRERFKYSEEHERVSGIDYLGNKVPYDQVYEDINDETQRVLKTGPQPKLTKRQNVSDIPGSDGYNTSIHDKNTGLPLITPKDVKIADAFLEARLTERQDYASPAQKDEEINQKIAKEYIEKKKL